MSKLKYIICIAYFLSSFWVVKAQTSTLKILSWNIYMLPRFIKNTGKIERAERIGQNLKESDYDVIVFQEAFHRGARRKIKAALEEKYPYMAGPANLQTFSLRTNSGLWILSKYPIEFSQEIKFKTKCGIDAFSRKGALMAQICVQGQKIQIIATHLQSSGESWLKESQCVEIANRITDYYKQDGVPQIICGDFNIEMASKSHYDNMLKILDAHDSEISGTHKFTFDRLNNDLNAEISKKQELIDYVLIRKNKSNVSFKEKLIKIFKHKWDDNHSDLSDHYAIEAQLEINHPGISLLNFDTNSNKISITK